VVERRTEDDMLRTILLAAGSGRRLGVSHPKCLLRFGERTLLERHLGALARLRVEEIAIVTGYERTQIEKELARVRPQPTLLFNPEFARGSVVSLWRAREWLQKGDDVLLMDADVLYDPALLDVLAARRGSALLLDRNYDDRAGEAMKVCLERERIVEFRKQLEFLHRQIRRVTIGGWTDQSNLVEKEESAGRLERINNEMSQRVLTMI